MSVSTNMIAEGELRLRLDRIQSRALAAGGLGLFLSLAAWSLWPGSSSCPRTWLLMRSGSGLPWAAWV